MCTQKVRCSNCSISHKYANIVVINGLGKDFRTASALYHPWQIHETKVLIIYCDDIGGIIGHVRTQLHAANLNLHGQCVRSDPSVT